MVVGFLIQIDESHRELMKTSLDEIKERIDALVEKEVE